jgi:hypothetical protein
MSSAIRAHLAEKIKENRPNISDSSIKTYVSVLMSLAKNLNFDNINQFEDDSEQILHHMKEKPARSRKTSLSALFVLTKKQEFRDAMLVDCKSVNDDYKSQTKSKKEEDNWVSISEVQKIYDQYLATAKAMLNGKQLLNPDVIVKFFCLVFLSGCSGLPPRRSMDIALLKVKNYDEAKDNFYDAKKKEFVFNQFKTSKVYGTQRVKLPSKELQLMCNRWVKLNPTSTFLFSSNQRSVTSSQISRILNSVFGGKAVSTDMLRHVYISDLYKDVPKMAELENIAHQMGHNLSTQQTYAKYDKNE